MPRLAKADVHAALIQAANHIKDASKPDGIASRADIKKTLGKLEGTERALVDMFYRFIDHRDAAPGARVTAKDIDKAIDYAKEKLINAYDLNNNGLSASEITEMSRTGQLATKLAREMKAVAPGGRGPAALGAELKKAVADGYCTITWEEGFIKEARVHTGWDNQGLSTADQLAAILALPEAAKMEGLKIGLADSDGMNEYGAILTSLEQAGPLAALEDLKIGDYEYSNDTEISWVTVGNIGGVLNAAPNLKNLHVVGGGSELGRVSHEHLESLTLESGGLPGSTVANLSHAELPNLEKLEVWFGAEEYGSGGNAGMLAGMLGGTNLPKLRELGLKNGEFQNDVAKALANAPILAQLERLDLSMGTLSDDGAQAILDKAAAFAHLQALDLSENFISEAKAAEVVAALPKATIGESKDQWGDPGDYSYFYVSVGE